MAQPPENRFVGREAERAAFLGNLELQAGADHRARFHVHGPSGVGKSFLVEEFKRLARERGALTAYVDEDAGSVPNALEMIYRQFAARGRRMKPLERRLDEYRERRREVEAALRAQDGGPESTSPGSRAFAELGLGVLESTVPGGALLGRALLAGLVAQGADRLRAGLSSRFRNADDIDLVLHPESALTPVFLRELRSAASGVPWTVLFFDTYERTGPFLDGWLHGLFRKRDEHGDVPGNPVVVTAGQLPLPTGRWTGAVELPLAPFTDAETRQLLAGRCAGMCSGSTTRHWPTSTARTRSTTASSRWSAGPGCATRAANRRRRTPTSTWRRPAPPTWRGSPRNAATTTA